MSDRTECIRCGECCRKSTPALHPEDRRLMEAGALTLSDIYTLREGEIVYDNVQDRLICLEEELIKLREKPGTRECIFYDPLSSGCAIYENRPLQCRVLECWRPQALASLYRSRKLTRLEIVTDPEMRSLIEAHNERVNLKLIKGLINGQPKGAEKEVLELINYDLHFREFLSQRLCLTDKDMEFYFGRPVAVLVHSLGFELVFDR